jgi:hypothetical protein
MRTTAFTCDRCNADCTADPGRNHLAIRSGHLTRGPHADGLDLCGPCASGLVEWLAAPPPRGDHEDDRRSLLNSGGTVRTAASHAPPPHGDHATLHGTD